MRGMAVLAGLVALVGGTTAWAGGFDLRAPSSIVSVDGALPNGMHVTVIEDHRSPVVAVRMPIRVLGRPVSEPSDPE
ncbi:MAG: hypothetical protein KDA24_25705 [Deltaproteobacteria bacterium]|nr:hypothetical protein [Deltaproteobacteria bacterium]